MSKTDSVIIRIHHLGQSRLLEKVLGVTCNDLFGSQITNKEYDLMVFLT